MSDLIASLFQPFGFPREALPYDVRPEGKEEAMQGVLTPLHGSTPSHSEN